MRHVRHLSCGNNQCFMLRSLVATQCLQDDLRGSMMDSVGRTKSHVRRNITSLQKLPSHNIRIDDYFS